MAQNRLRKATAGIAVASLSVAAHAQQPAASPKPMPPSPWNLEPAAWNVGNPLARYLAIQQHDAEYRTDKENRSNYLQTLAAFISWLGDVEEADRLFDEAVGARHRPDLEEKNTPLAGYKPVNAEAFILKVAEQNRVIMIDEAHQLPHHRVLVTRLLKPLYDRGFRYLALETLNEEAVEATTRRKYPTLKTGYYTTDPVFGDEVRQALEIGFTLVAYESSEPDQPGDKPIDRMNRREMAQAHHLKERIFDKDPKAKVLVHVGGSHNSKKPQPVGEKEPWVFMAIRFKELTGIDPFTVDQRVMRPHLDSSVEEPLYREAVRRGWVTDRPVIFADSQNHPFSEVQPGTAVDAQVFLPPVRYDHGRPDWLVRDLGRVPTPIPESLWKGQGIRLVQAFFEGEPDDAIPIDQVLIRPGQELPVLMLPTRNGGRFRVRVWDGSGKSSPFVPLTVIHP